MRLAVLADIHGNIYALEAVLADLKRQAPDVVVVLGDSVVKISAKLAPYSMRWMTSHMSALPATWNGACRRCSVTSAPI